MDNDTNKSNFVSVLAWIFIVLTGFGTVITLFQNIMIRIMFSGERMKEALSQAENTENMPEYATFMFSNFNTFFLLIFFLSLFLFITSIALLKRKNWARVSFIGFMALGIVWNIVGLYLQANIMPDLSSVQGSEVSAKFESMMNLMRIVTYIFAIGLSILYIWIIKKLLSKNILEEFKTT
ncbi:MAG: hypothetical protein GXP23_07640 [Gammaproteobacteria bacterium]|nr:hypothetical protein [Gammaproteobacteria bacterium]